MDVFPRLSLRERSEGHEDSIVIGASLAFPATSASSIAMAVAGPDATMPSGDGVPEGADILRKGKCELLRLITCLTGMNSHLQPRCAQLAFSLSHKVTGNMVQLTGMLYRGVTIVTL